MISKLKKFLRGERGITGLETAIILIAFVVVAAVFAFTVLSAGVFSADRGKEAVYSGLSEVSGSMEVRGSVIAYGNSNTDVVLTVVFSLANVAGGQPVDLAPPTDTTPTYDGIADANSQHRVVINYRDQSTRFTDLAWSKTALGSDDGDNLLETGEVFEITVPLSRSAANPNLKTNTPFVLELKPPTGGVIVIERTTPSNIDTINDLH
jgi:flagellin FlaB